MPHKFVHNQLRHEIIGVCNTQIGYLDVYTLKSGNVGFEITLHDEDYIDLVNDALTSADISYDVDDVTYNIRRDEEKLTVEDVLSAFDNIKVN
jgi:hypothetical protein